MGFSFFRALGGAHANKLMQKVTDEIVELDPTTASEAQLAMMEQDLDKAGSLLAKFKTDFNREKKEADAQQTKFDRLTAAAAQLNATYEAETDPAKKASLEVSLGNFLGTLEKEHAELERELREAADAKTLVDQTEAIYTEKAQALRTAKAKLAEGARALERSKLQHEQAQMQAENAAQVAGLRNGNSGGLSAALNAMERQTDKNRGEADALKIKATVLTKVEEGSLEDPNVLAALAAAKTPSSSLSFKDRLAALGAAPKAPAQLQIEGSTSNA